MWNLLVSVSWIIALLFIATSMLAGMPLVIESLGNGLMRAWVWFLMRRMDRARTVRAARFWERLAIWTTPRDW